MVTVKNRIRQEVQIKEKKLSPAYKKQSDQKIYEQILQLPAYQRAETIFCFVGMPNEVNTHLIIEQAWKQGKLVCVPRCVGPGKMHAYKILSWEDVAPGTWDILEPGPSCTLVEPSQIDLALIPCCSAWKDGRRLGFGGGFYDRYTEHESFIKAVICRQALMRDDIPIEAHDQRMDIVISDDTVYYISGF